jgi:hypothetical protein
MKLFTMRELTAQTKMVCDAASASDPAVITVNGKPSKMLFDISGQDLELQVKAFRQARLMNLAESMRQDAAGVEMGMDDIDAIIATSRAERGVACS